MLVIISLYNKIPTNIHLILLDRPCYASYSLVFNAFPLSKRESGKINGNFNSMMLCE